MGLKIGTILGLLAASFVISYLLATGVSLSALELNTIVIYILIFLMTAGVIAGVRRFFLK